MTDYQSADIYDDNGAVHLNDGVGNKTAYLISQGGTFNGQTGIVGIDGERPRPHQDRPALPRGDPAAHVRRAVRRPRSHPGRHLRRASPATATDGFTTADCDSVRAAVAATQLELAPRNTTAFNHEAPSTCATGARLVELRRDDDNVQQFGFTANGLWQRTPANGTPTYTRSGQQLVVRLGPRPDAVDGISTSQIISSAVHAAGRAADVPALRPRLRHGVVRRLAGQPASTTTAARAFVQTLSGGTWTTRTVPWDNGPNKTLAGTSTKVFGGDSHGYGSSRMNLTSLAGQTVRVVFRVTGDENARRVRLVGRRHPRLHLPQRRRLRPGHDRGGSDHDRRW